MEILTLVREDIRHKKGAFRSILLLTIVITMSFSTVISLRDNNYRSVEKAFSDTDTGDIMALILDVNYSDELIEKVENVSSVKKVISREGIWNQSCQLEDGTTFGQGNFIVHKYDERYRALDEDMKSYADETPKPEKGEVYIAQSLNTQYGCEKGDMIKIDIAGSSYDFKIKGFVVDPELGNYNVATKYLFICEEDFSKITGKAKEFETVASEGYDKTFGSSGLMHTVWVYKNDDTINDREFKRQVNKGSDLSRYSTASFSKSTLISYTLLLVDVVIGVLLVFVVILLGIVLIIMAHSISTSIEMDYSTLGMLKAQGFSNTKIRCVYALQYLIAIVLGSIIGFVLSIPCMRLLGDVFQPLTCIPTGNEMSVIKILLFTLAVLFVSVCMVIFSTRKIGKISPVKAISKSGNDVYFTSRTNLKLSPKALTVSLAFKTLASDKGRYMAIVLIVAVLMFFMMSMSVLSSSYDSKSSLESMGIWVAELFVSSDDAIPEETLKDIEKIITDHTAIEKKYQISQIYLTLEGDDYACLVAKDPEVLVTTDGRAEKYDNEVSLNVLLAEELGYKIGDTVSISFKDSKQDYIITGYFTSVNETGNCFSLTEEGAARIGVEVYLDQYSQYSLSDPTKGEKIADDINGKYGDTITATFSDDFMSGNDMYRTAINVVSAIIYVFAIVFSLIIVIIVCTKSFLRERRDIGIFKAVGLSSNKLRLQFAMRFLIVSIIGAALGTVLSFLFTEKLLSLLLRYFGIWKLNGEFTAFTILIPAMVICLGFFIFSYFASRKIKTVEIKELVIE